MARLYIARDRVFYETESSLAILGDIIINGTLASWDVSGGLAVATNADDTLAVAAAASFTPVEGQKYSMQFNVSGYTGGSVNPVFGNVELSPAAVGNGTHYYEIVATAAMATSDVHGLKGTGYSATVNNLYIREADLVSFTYTYDYSGVDINAYAVIFHLEYKEIRLPGITLSNVDQSIPIQQNIDRVYLNP